MKKRMSWIDIAASIGAVFEVGLIVVKNTQAHNGPQLLNVSYDPTRELHHDLRVWARRP